MVIEFVKEENMLIDTWYMTMGPLAYFGVMILFYAFFVEDLKEDRAMKNLWVLFWPLTLLCAILNLPFNLFKKRIERMKRWNEGARNASRRVHAIEELQDKMSELEHQVASLQEYVVEKQKNKK